MVTDRCVGAVGIRVTTPVTGQALVDVRAGLGLSGVQHVVIQLEGPATDVKGQAILIGPHIPLGTGQALEARLRVPTALLEAGHWAQGGTLKKLS